MDRLIFAGVLVVVIAGGVLFPPRAVAEGMQADVHGLVVPETLDAADRASALYL